MRAITLVPRKQGSARLDDLPEPRESAGAVLVEALELGICGTDIEIVQGEYGWPPSGHERLVLGHESLGRVLEAPDGGELAPGDLVVGIVRRPDPEPCANCAAGEWDMCRNGRDTEHGIKGADGFLSERFRVEPGRAVRAGASLGRLAVLTEPTSVVAKAWEQAERIGGRTAWTPRRALVTGACPLGLLTAMLGVRRDLEIHVLDMIETGPKADRARELGARYSSRSLDGLAGEFDVAIDCTGVGPLVFHSMQHLAPDGVMVMTGISGAPREAEIAVDALNKRIVLNNNAFVGSVSANRRHYEEAVRALSGADRGWLVRLVTRWVPLERWSEALERRENDLKVVVEVAP
jgi:threonine dehydrogenase-like Zn-dependent dehydrogenase